MFRELEHKKRSEVESSISEYWERIKILDRCIETRKKPFVFYDGPATANGFPGLHHMVAKFLKDSFCKYKTMQGYKVLRKVGWDTHGLPVEVEVEKTLGFKNKNDYEKFEFPKPIKLKLTMQDLLLENAKEGSVQFKNGELKVLSKEGQKTNEKLFLSQKLIDYILCPGTKNFYHDDAEIDLPVARALLSTMGNTHRASVNNYVTTNGRIRALDPRETHRLMGFPDDYKIVVSKAQAYKQSGNSIVVSVLKHILDSIYGG